MVDIATYKAQFDLIAAALNIAWEDLSDARQPLRQLEQHFDWDSVNAVWVVKTAYIDSAYAGHYGAKTKGTGGSVAYIAPVIPIPPSAVITTAAGTTIAPAVITLGGDWSANTINYGMTLTPAEPIAGAAASGTGTAAAAAILLAADIAAKSANITAAAVGDTVEVLALGLATAVNIDTLTIT
jgi:hypothetical protein